MKQNTPGRKSLKQITHDRLHLLSLGYEPLGSVDKACYLKDRNNLDINEALIMSWDRKHMPCTGLRTGFLVGIDLDIEDDALVEAMRDAAFDNLGVTDYIRIGKPPREMLCYQIDGSIPARKLLGAKYENGSGVTHRVEVYGDGFYIGAFGRHSEEHEYTWPRSSLMDADIDDLPTVTAESLGDFMVASARVFESRGLTEVGPDPRGPGYVSDAHVVHDLELDTVIDGVTVSSWMKRLSGSGSSSSHRCSALDFRADAGNETSMVLQLTPTGELCATDHPADMVHMLTPGAVVALEESWMSAIGSFVSESDTMFSLAPMEWLLGNIVTLTIGGYYDLSRFEYLPTSKVLDSIYGHLARITVGSQGGVKRTPPSGMLACDSSRLVASGLCWQPCRDLEYVPILRMDGHKMVNTFRAPDIMPVPGDVSLWLSLVDHICGDHASLVLDHMAFTVANPSSKIAWQILVSGVPRTGKTMMFEPMTRGLGSMAQLVHGDDLKAGWGDVFARRKVLLVEEVYGFDGKMFNLLKPKFTNSGIESLNMKGEKPLYQPNLYSMYMLTNHMDAFKMGADEDKLLAIRAPGHKIFGESRESEDFYNELGRLKHDHVYQSHVLHYLLSRDISGFKHGALPVRTDALYDMVEAAQADYVHALYDMDEEGVWPFNKACVVLDDVRDELRSKGYTFGRKGVATALYTLGFENIESQKKVSGQLKKRRFWCKPENLTGATPSEWYEFFSQNPVL